MPPSPVTMHPDTSIPGLKALFERYDFNAFLVVDERGVLRGPVSKLDLLRVFRPDWRRGEIPGVLALWAERVEDIMSRDVAAIDPDETPRTPDVSSQPGLNAILWLDVSVL